MLSVLFFIFISSIVGVFFFFFLTPGFGLVVSSRYRFVSFRLIFFVSSWRARVLVLVRVLVHVLVLVLLLVPVPVLVLMLVFVCVFYFILFGRILPSAQACRFTWTGRSSCRGRGGNPPWSWKARATTDVRIYCLLLMFSCTVLNNQYFEVSTAECINDDGRMIFFQV